MISSYRRTIIFFLVFFFSSQIFSQATQIDQEKEKQLREEILAVYQSRGEPGLRDLFKEKEKEITCPFIRRFFIAGTDEKKEEWLKVCEILIVEKKNEKADEEDILIQGRILQRIGDNYHNANNYLKAFEFYEKALILFKQINDSGRIGENLFRKGMIYIYLGKFEKALEMYNEALPFFEKTGDLTGQGNMYKGIGDVYLNKEEHEKALNMYNKAIKFFQESNETLRIGEIFVQIGQIYYRLGDCSKALSMYGKALSAFKKINAITSQGNVYIQYGVIYSDKGDYLKALEQYDIALKIFEKENILLEIANIYYGRGFIYYRTGNYSNALEMYEKALAYYEKVGNPRGQEIAFECMSNVYYFMGNNIKSLEMCEKTLLLLAKAESPTLSGNVYNRKGDIYRDTGNYQKALEMYEKALSNFEKAENPTGTGNAYLNKGILYSLQGDHPNALKFCEQALTMYQKINFQFGMKEMGDAFGCMGSIYFNSGENSKAMDMYEKALNLYIKLDFPIGQGNIYKNKGDIFFRTRNIPDAIAMYEKALALFETIGDINSEFTTLYAKGKVLAKQGKTNEAINFFERSISQLEKYRFQSAVPELKETFMGTVYERYEEIVQFMLENKYYEKAFNYAEAMKARVFLDQMAEGLIGLEKGMKPELKEEKVKIVGKLSALSKQMQESNSKDKKKLLELKKEYHNAESEFHDLLIKIRLENPLYAAVNYPQPVSVQDLQKEILKDSEALLSYFISQHETYAFIISKNNFNIEPLHANEDEVNGFIERYMLAIKENNAVNMKRYGSVLYEKLFKPLEKYLEKNRDIIIVPTGQLETIPFESLVIAKNPGPPIYLLEKYRVKYVQNATLLSILRKQYWHYTLNNTARGFVGFGDPVYNYEDFAKSNSQQNDMVSRGETPRDPKENHPVSSFPSAEIKEIHQERYARSGGIMDRIPQSGTEIQAIAQLFEKDSLPGIVYLREQASEEHAKLENMKDFAYIHFSCHGILNDDFQCLVLSQLPGDKTKEDGYFTLNEIMNCDYNARLVVLSACDTGSGKMIKGEGVTGLTRAVMYAGTPAVVASLWNIDDNAAKILMIAFYRNIIEKNMDKTEALRQAKLELLNNNQYASPLYWSSFIMYGE